MFDDLVKKEEPELELDLDEYEEELEEKYTICDHCDAIMIEGEECGCEKDECGCVGVGA